MTTLIVSLALLGAPVPSHHPIRHHVHRQASGSSYPYAVGPTAIDASITPPTNVTHGSTFKVSLSWTDSDTWMDPNPGGGYTANVYGGSTFITPTVDADVDKKDPNGNVGSSAFYLIGDSDPTRGPNRCVKEYLYMTNNLNVTYPIFRRWGVQLNNGAPTPIKDIPGPHPDTIIQIN